MNKIIIKIERSDCSMLRELSAAIEAIEDPKEKKAMREEHFAFYTALGMKYGYDAVKVGGVDLTKGEVWVDPSAIINPVLAGMDRRVP